MEKFKADVPDYSEIPAAANDNRAPVEQFEVPAAANDNRLPGSESLSEAEPLLQESALEVSTEEKATEAEVLQETVDTELKALNEHRAQMGLSPLAEHDVPAVREEVDQLQQLEQTPDVAPEEASVVETSVQESRVEQTIQSIEIHAGVIEVPAKKVQRYVDLFTRNNVRFTVRSEGGKRVWIELDIPGTLELRTIVPETDGGGDGGGTPKDKDIEEMLQTLGTIETPQNAPAEQEALATPEQLVEEPGEAAPETPTLEETPAQPQSFTPPAEIPPAANDNRQSPPTAANDNRSDIGQVAV